MEDTSLPSYRSLIEYFLNDQPPSYQAVTGIVVKNAEVRPKLFQVLRQVILRFFLRRLFLRKVCTPIWIISKVLETFSCALLHYPLLSCC